MVPLKGGTNKIKAACHPQAFLFSVFLSKTGPTGVLLKFGVGSVTAIQMFSYCFKPKADFYATIFLKRLLHASSLPLASVRNDGLFASSNFSNHHCPNRSTLYGLGADVPSVVKVIAQTFNYPLTEQG